MYDDDDGATAFMVNNNKTETQLRATREKSSHLPSITTSDEMRIVHASNSKLRQRIKSIIGTGNHPARCVEVLSCTDLSAAPAPALPACDSSVCQLQSHLMLTSLLAGAPSRASITHEIKTQTTAFNRLHTPPRPEPRGRREGVYSSLTAKMNNIWISQLWAQILTRVPT